MTWGRTYWPAALSVLLAVIFIPEIYALITNDQNTLSWWTWDELNVSSRQPVQDWTAPHYLVFGGWLVLVSWLTWHLFFHWFT